MWPITEEPTQSNGPISITLLCVIIRSRNPLFSPHNKPIRSTPTNAIESFNPTLQFFSLNLLSFERECWWVITLKRALIRVVLGFHPPMAADPPTIQTTFHEEPHWPSPLNNPTVFRLPSWFLFIFLTIFHPPTIDVSEQRSSIICFSLPFFPLIAWPFSLIGLFSSFYSSLRLVLFDWMRFGRMLEFWRTGSKLTGNDRNPSSCSLISLMHFFCFPWLFLRCFLCFLGQSFGFWFGIFGFWLAFDNTLGTTIVVRIIVLSGCIVFSLKKPLV